MKLVLAAELSRNPYPSLTRAAVVPFTISDGNLYFCFGKDSGSGDITDAGGGRKSNETVLEAGLREWTEEFRKIFGKLHTDYNSTNLFISAISEKKHKAVIFHPVSPKEIMNAPNRFRVSLVEDKFTYKAYNELVDILWLDIRTIRDLLRYPKKGKMWSELRPFYRELLAKSEFFDSLRNSFNYHFRNGRC